MEEYRTAYVYVQNQFAGTVHETEDGYEFAYDSRYLQQEHPAAVSLTLPVREQAYQSNILFPFFDGLIPEGWLLNIVCHNWKLNANDRFGLLMYACRDSIGDVSIRDSRE